MVRFPSLAIALNLGEANELPTAFRLFAAGVNKTEKGDFLFDDAAAKAVMSKYQTWGIDPMIDLEHLSLDPESTNYDPDARGWFRLEMRNGELWAVDVRWTDDGAQRLTQKRQRYVSPAFAADPKTRRITKIINVAITSIPATHHTPALVAASGRGSMNLEAVKKALEALVSGDSEAAAKLLQDMIAEAAAGGGEAAPAPPDAQASAPAPEAQAAAMPAAAPAPSGEQKPEDEEKKAAMVATSRLMSVTGAKDVITALSAVETFKASHVALEAERQKLAEERKTLEAAERRKLCGELITLGAEFPSTVWADDSASSMKSRWQSMPIEQLRDHVGEQRAARGKAAPVAPPNTPPAEAGGKSFTTPHGVVTLSASELATCVEVGAKPEIYAANKAFLAHGRK